MLKTKLTLLETRFEKKVNLRKFDKYFTDVQRNAAGQLVDA